MNPFQVYKANSPQIYLLPNNAINFCLFSIVYHVPYVISIITFLMDDNKSPRISYEYGISRGIRSSICNWDYCHICFVNFSSTISFFRFRESELNCYCSIQYDFLYYSNYNVTYPHQLHSKQLYQSLSYTPVIVLLF